MTQKSKESVEFMLKWKLKYVYGIQYSYFVEFPLLFIPWYKEKLFLKQRF